MPASTQAVGLTISELLSGALIPEKLKRLPVAGIQLDSRRVSPGDLFLAVPGTASDGRTFIAEALKAGAVAVAAEADGLLERNERVIPVANLAQRASAIAGCFYGNPSFELSLTGVTGTNGKTTSSYLLGQLLSLLNGRCGLIGTLGFGVFDSGKTSLRALGMTTPDALLTQSLLADALQADAQSAVMEVSSHSLDQGRVAALQFDVAIFTNLSRDHLDYHGDMHSYRDAKFKLFRQAGLKYAVINLDDPVGRDIAGELPSTVQLIGFGLESKGAVRVNDLASDRQGYTGILHTPWGNGAFSTSLPGKFNLLNLMGVIAAACCQGYELDDVLSHVKNLEPAPGRMQCITPPHAAAPLVFIDYAHTPDALSSALGALRGHCRGKLHVVFGCGGDRDKGKRAEMGRIASELADEVTITSDNPRSEPPLIIINQVAEGAIKPCRLIESRREAIDTVIAGAKPGDVVLIAGKGHEPYQQVGEEKLPFSDIEHGRKALQAAWGIEP